VSTANIARDLAAMVFGEPYQIPQEQASVTVAPSVLDSYVGQYKLSATAAQRTCC